MVEEMRVGVTKKQGRCFRCGQDKEVVLFSTSSFGVGKTTEDAKKNIIAASELWVCDGCFEAAVAEQPRVHYI